jgi:LPXTG-motif cell wall-anchored protein
VTKRRLFFAVVVACLFVAAPAALAQEADDAYTTPGPGQERLAVGGVELVNPGATAPTVTPARATVAGTQEVRGGTLPVTGADVTTLVAVGITLIAVGAVLRRQRQLTLR